MKCLRCSSPSVQIKKMSSINLHQIRHSFIHSVAFIPADKGSGTVVMDRSWYVNECHRQLNDAKYYKKQSSDLTGKIHERVKEYTSRLHKNNLIDYETFKYLSSNSDPKSGRFYILPKIHKQGNPGRPIVSSNSHPTAKLVRSRGRSHRRSRVLEHTEFRRFECP